MKHIVILGGSYAGVSTAHRILKQAAKIGPLKITIVSPNTHFYWSMASPRGVVPGQIPDEKLFQPIVPGFSKYSASQFEFITASAASLDFGAKTVSLSSGDTLDYDYIILATGSRTREHTPFKGVGTTEETRNALHDFQSEVTNSKTIVIAGAGVTGVEVAGELAFEYGPAKKIILIAAGSTVLDDAPASISAYSLKALKNLNVDLKMKAKVTGTVRLPNGRKELTLSSGDKLTTDMYVPTFGLMPNSSYVPKDYLDKNGSVKVDEFLRVKGAKDAWAIGDVSNVESWQFITCDRQSTRLAKNMISMINNKPPVPYKVAASKFMGLQIGKKQATGHFGNFKLPTFIVVRARKTLFTENLGPTVTGTLF
ncbi:hypothetical protein LTR35_017891 [Friedmanniomyces endolithicus]|uniref:FAD/NAD(P)-binding domain-containing protein n=1 Tax=Friedmanniomyces endolithicus TaxID=329885 RepID=A0AAN6F5I2_9PEZI|nr:hypothetical protein LTR35_017891 [Friedmanniomyces endolithicus]KAK0267719.1 hypothetical protein LTS00_017745 [Friedmanniomyces endolithicus]KAK0302228.1 hypothetical protein LTR82_017948 [Friedmanniomyces endolithicus]